MDWATASRVAEKLVELLRPCCERIEVAGSIRRRKGEVKDVELVAIPRIERALAGENVLREPVEVSTNLLEGAIETWLASGMAKPRLDKRDRRAIGPSYKRLMVKMGYVGWVPVDLFVVVPPNCPKCGIISGRYGEATSSQLPHLRQAVPGTETQEDVQPLMPSDARLEPREAGAGALPGEVRDLREALPDQGLQRTPDLFDEMRNRSSGTPEAGEEASELEGTPSTQGAVSSEIHAESPESGREGLRGGTSASSGGAHRALLGGIRESTSPQRDQERQPDRESGDRDPGSPERNRNLSPLPQSIPSSLVCPRCNRRLRIPQWGLILLIRTGSGVGATGSPLDGFGPAMLARWKRVSGGGYSKDGQLHRADGTPVETPLEADVFKACQMLWVPPEERVDSRAVARFAV